MGGEGDFGGIDFSKLGGGMDMGGMGGPPGEEEELSSEEDEEMPDLESEKKEVVGTADTGKEAA